MEWKLSISYSNYSMSHFVTCNWYEKQTSKKIYYHGNGEGDIGRGNRPYADVKRLRRINDCLPQWNPFPKTKTQRLIPQERNILL